MKGPRWFVVTQTGRVAGELCARLPKSAVRRGAEAIAREIGAAVVAVKAASRQAAVGARGVRANPTLVQHGLAVAASHHLLEHGGTSMSPAPAPLAELYGMTPQRARLVAQAISDAIARPIYVLDNRDTPGKLLEHGRETLRPRGRANPGHQAPKAGEWWVGLDGKADKIVNVQPTRLLVLHGESGNREWIDRGEFVATHRPRSGRVSNPKGRAPEFAKVKIALVRAPGYPIGTPAPMHATCACGQRLEFPGGRSSVVCPRCERAWSSTGWLSSAKSNPRRRASAAVSGEACRRAPAAPARRLNPSRSDYEIRGVREIDGNMELVDDSEAEVFGLYKRDQHGLPMWVEDYPTRADAQAALEALLSPKSNPKAEPGYLESTTVTPVFRLNNGLLVAGWDDGRGPRHYMSRPQAERARMKLLDRGSWEVFRPAAGRSYYFRLREDSYWQVPAVDPRRMHGRPNAGRSRKRADDWDVLTENHIEVARLDGLTLAEAKQQAEELARERGDSYLVLFSRSSGKAYHSNPKRGRSSSVSACQKRRHNPGCPCSPKCCGARGPRCECRCRGTYHRGGAGGPRPFFNPPQGHREPTRTRARGTRVTKPASGEERIAALREIVARSQYAKIDGVMVDLFTASTIVQVYDALNDTNRAKYREMPVQLMASIAFKLAKGAQPNPSGYSKGWRRAWASCLRIYGNPTARGPWTFSKRVRGRRITVTVEREPVPGTPLQATSLGGLGQLHYATTTAEPGVGIVVVTGRNGLEGWAVTPLPSKADALEAYRAIVVRSAKGAEHNPRGPATGYVIQATIAPVSCRRGRGATRKVLGTLVSEAASEGSAAGLAASGTTFTGDLAELAAAPELAPASGLELAPAPEAVPVSTLERARQGKRDLQPGERVSVPYSGRLSYFGRTVKRTHERGIVEGYTQLSPPMVMVRVHRGRSVETHEFPESAVRRLPTPSTKAAGDRTKREVARLERAAARGNAPSRTDLDRLIAERDEADRIAHELYPQGTDKPTPAYNRARAAMRRLNARIAALNTFLWQHEAADTSFDPAAFANPRRNSPHMARAFQSGRSQSWWVEWSTDGDPESEGLLQMPNAEAAHAFVAAWRAGAGLSTALRASRELGTELNPSRRGRRARPNPGNDHERAVDAFRMWHDREPKKIVTVHGPDRVPKVLAKLGDLEAIVYRSDKWAGTPDNPKGEQRLYEHRTKRPKPVLASDGRNVFIVGGRMKPTAAGLVN